MEVLCLVLNIKALLRPMSSKRIHFWSITLTQLRGNLVDYLHRRICSLKALTNRAVYDKVVNNHEVDSTDRPRSFVGQYDGGKGPNVLDLGGQGVLHFVAALGYDWAIPPTIAAWRADSGPCYLLGAAPEALTDPTPTYLAGRPPAELAANNGHKGIADTKRIATPADYGDLPHRLSMKYSLAVRQLKEYMDGEFGMSDERAHSLLALKTKKAGQHDQSLDAAAAVYVKVSNNWEVDCDADLIDLEALLDGDTLMQTSS
ncbi:UNVERIFIED_CONTAM: Calmodulin-binding transcription activator 3 [Sesamum calycinum]|uniref:Calmodulin-binding transcription activator 3 n=1 Tax=Sesamum calycinum TaxID=2727403 RepID=A0AAW2Q2W2_9LAMI